MAAAAKALPQPWVCYGSCERAVGFSALSVHDHTSASPLGVSPQERPLKPLSCLCRLCSVAGLRLRRITHRCNALVCGRSIFAALALFLVSRGPRPTSQMAAGATAAVVLSALAVQDRSFVIELLRPHAGHLTARRAEQTVVAVRTSWSMLGGLHARCSRPGRVSEIARLTERTAFVARESIPNLHHTLCYRAVSLWDIPQ